jgi:pimeloyl-ACP methyl ester carboxylesterase
MGIKEGRVVANGLEFAYLEAGHGPLALCLHGFPDSAHTWRHLLPQLADAGYHAVAPFLRGYAPTAVPADGRYQSGVLSQDAIALHEVLGGGPDAAIVGHDWGAPAAYGAAVSAPDRWSKVVGMAVPPGPALGQAIVTNPDQLKRSWYMFFFQHPLADLVVPLDDLAFVDRLWADWSPGFDATEELALLKPSLRDPANLGAALGYYRATVGGVGNDPALADLQAATQACPPQPVLYLHGSGDGCIGVEVAELANDLLPEHVRVHEIDFAGHFLHLERPAEVHELVLGFLAS